MRTKPASMIDGVKINIARAFNFLYYRTMLPLFRVLGDIIIRYSKVIINNVVYVIIDLSSLYIINPTYERKVIHASLTLPPNTVFIDIGAHVGKYALSLAKRGINIIAIEPNPVAFKALLKGIELNGLNNVRPLNLALSDYDGMGKLYCKQSSVISSIKKQDNTVATIDVIVKKLDTLVQEMKLERIDFIKIDVEGAEIEVVKGGMRTIAKFRPIIVAESEFENYDQLLVLFEKLGYNCQVLEEYRNEGYFNLLCIPNNPT